MTNIQLNHYIRKNSDLIVVLGSRLGKTNWWDREPYWNQKDQKIIQIDIDPSIIGSSRNIELGGVSDIKSFLRNFINIIKNHNELRKAEFDWVRKNQKIKILEENYKKF